jgi:hypothetical protein
MNPTAAAATSSYPIGPSIHFINLAYFFELLYGLFFSGQFPSFDNVGDMLSTVWLFYSLFAFLLCLICVGALAYMMTRIHQVEEEDQKRYDTISHEEAHDKLEDSRWTYIKNLIESPQESDWRQAIIEADIMLEEVLRRQGYEGATIGDMLKSARQENFHTLNDAWDAHRVRNDIAHRGSEFQLSPNIAYRTINQYENVFREFGEI